MNSITYVGMDVHTSNFTLCCYSMSTDRTFAVVQVEPSYKEILKYLERIQQQHEEDMQFVCGYEAGCLGYSLQRELAEQGVECVILAPSTMPQVAGNHIKTDKRDAENISRCLAYGTYRAVYVPDEEDDAVKEYIRMRNDVKVQLKSLKQQIIAFCTRHGFQFDGRSYWTQRHLQWLEQLVFSNSVYKETLTEYLALYFVLTEKIEVFDLRIKEFSRMDRYQEDAKKLECFSGIATNTAMSFLTEIGDFHRFATAQQFAAYLGLTPGEHSSGNKQHRTGITKAGNSHLRRLLVEAAQHYSRGTIGKKSRTMKAKQQGNTSEVIAYADKANERLKRKYHRIAFRSKTNIAKTAVARELACFIWGMMTDNISSAI